MAELASPLVESIVKLLTDAAIKHIGHVSAFHTNLNSLKNTFLRIQPRLHDAEVQQWNHDEIRVWLTELKDVAHDVENVLDEVATQDLRRQAEMELERGKSCLCFRNSLSFRCRMARKVKTVGDKLTKLAREGEKFNLRELHELQNRETCSMVIESQIFGRRDDKEKIIEKLLNEELEQSDISVYVIWGMGGMGKTTLAQLVYNNEDVEKHFGLRIWVCVSEDFDVKRLVKAIIESIDGCGCTLSDLDPLQRNLREKLMKKKFLLVLDDIWNEDAMKWDELRNILSCGSKGSVVMVTTRNEKIALMMATIGTHAIGFLSDEDSWHLFKQRAFPTGQEVDENMVSIGKAIVKKCGGVALAIKALGGVMRSKSTETEWLTVVNSELWNVLVGNENDITPALRLSYYNLPPYMRQCFAYCCVFPKDYEMRKDELIQLWMANGFVPSVIGQEDLFISGISIFKELTWRSFFQDIQKDYWGRTTCKMHDLMHDLAESIMSHDFYNINHERALEISKPMHLVCSDDCDFKLNKSIGNSVRTFYAFGRSTKVDEDLCSFILKQKYLRVLSFKHESSTKLLNLTYKFKHLRFLVLSCYHCKNVPESITTLYNLQTLKLLNSGNLRELPKQLKVMKNLWFLEMDGTGSLECTPPDLRKLTLLRRLPIFIVGEDALQQIDQLKELNLGGKLTIKGLNNVRSFEDSRNANLMMKPGLTYLELVWTGDIGNKSPSHFDLVLQGLQPHYNIERVRIRKFPGSKFSNWMSDSSYKNLKEIELSKSNCEYLPPMGNLPCLTNLIMSELNCINCLGADWHRNEECSFPRLETMKIGGMANLEEWSTPELMRSYPCLTNLKIWWCPKLSSMPSFSNIKDMEIIDPCCVAVITSINNCTSLESLKFKYNALPQDFLQNHKALKSLRIRGSGIKSMSNMLNNLSALKALNIHSCHKLREFPAAVLEGLSSLESLYFKDCSELEALCGPLENPSPLQELWFWGLPKLQCLPECVQQLTALTELDIYDCVGLQKLGESITSLKSLRWLDISNCSEELKKRCEKEEGEDWPNISHIPYIQINDDIIQDQRRSN